MSSPSTSSRRPAVPQGFVAAVSSRGDIAVVEVGRRLQGGLMAAALLFGGPLATASSANASILASSRIDFAMGRDAIVTPELNEIHHRFGTPYRSIAVTGALILVFLLVADLRLLARLVTGSLVPDVVDDVDCSVLLAEKRRHRGLLQRFFGQR